MYRTLSVLLLVTQCSVAWAESLLEVDTIIARHIEARGGYDAIKAIQSLVFEKGLYKEGAYEGKGNATMMLKRPYFKLVGHPERPGGFMEGYDGAAWEWFADPGIAIRTVGAASAASRHGADVEGPLVDYRQKGYRVKLKGIENRRSGPAYPIVVTMPDGYRTELLVDQESFLIVASRHAAPIHAFGEPVLSESTVEDYRRVNGVLFAHRFVERRVADGEVMSSMQWGSITANKGMPDRWFSPPEFERTPIQRFIEQLYVQRTDNHAFMWTYAAFRRANPDTETRVAIEVVGYQMLKMGEVEQAIMILEANRRDYPDSADSAFGLGRAYDTAGYTAAARAEYQRALALQTDHGRAKTALETLDE